MTIITTTTIAKTAIAITKLSVVAGLDLYVVVVVVVDATTIITVVIGSIIAFTARSCLLPAAASTIPTAISYPAPTTPVVSTTIGITTAATVRPFTSRTIGRAITAKAKT